MVHHYGTIVIAASTVFYNRYWSKANSIAKQNDDIAKAVKNLSENGATKIHMHTYIAMR